MAERYLFFDSTPTDRREYNSQDFALYFNKVLSDGLFSVDGNPILNVKVEDGTLNYTVTEGSALIKGHLYVNTSDLNKTFENPDPDNDRIDRIVLQLDLSQEGRFIKVVTKTGVPSSNPVAPELVRGEAVYELSLGQILVKKNTASVSALNYTDERLDEDLCGIVNSQITAPTEAMQQQFDAWFDSIKAGVEGDVNEWVEQQQEEFTQWMSDSKVGFDGWFEDIKGSLEGDVATNLTLRIGEVENNLATHLSESATLTQKGHVQLSSAVNSESETLASTPKAIKQAYDLAQSAFTSASNGKTLVGEAVTGVDGTVEIPEEPTFQDLATAIRSISTGKKWASGTYLANQDWRNNSYVNIPLSLNFEPSLLILYIDAVLRQKTAALYPGNLSQPVVFYSKDSSFFGGKTSNQLEGAGSNQYVRVSIATLSASNAYLNIFSYGNGSTVAYDGDMPIHWLAIG